MSSDDDGHVLVVEGNNPASQEIGGRFFSMGYYRYILAASQSEAYEQLKKHRFDLVMLNHCLPIFNGQPPRPETGLNLLKYIRIKLNIAASALPAIMMSSCRNDMESGMCFAAAGANDCIPLPFEAARESLEVKIERQMAGRDRNLVEVYKSMKIDIPSTSPLPDQQLASTQKRFLEIDVSQELVHYHGELIKLQPLQFKLLLLLARTPGVFVKRSKIFDTLSGVSGRDEDNRPNEEQINKAKSLLVSAFSPVMGKKKFIETKTKVGISLNIPEKKITIIGKIKRNPPSASVGDEKSKLINASFTPFPCPEKASSFCHP